MTDPAGKITYYNRAAAELAGRGPQIGKDEWCVTFRLFYSDGRPMPLEECPMAIALKENRPVRGVEAMAQRPDGALFPFLPFPTPIRNKQGELTGAVNMLIDISDRKESETNQRMLLDELNHRVKNNLQMLHSLLLASYRESSGRDASSVLLDAAQRVAALSAAQKLLYTASNPHSFNVSELLHAVSQTARLTFGDHVSVEIRAEEIYLSNEVSMPLALILHELLTNAVKHGVNDRGTGDITVTFTRSNGDVVLCVEDDGPGFEAQQSDRRSSGLALVRGLARQLGGIFAVEGNSGARCVVRFPDERIR
jgi:PAS domain S-box-containing protein